MGHQELAGRSRFTWQGSEFSFVMIPGVILIISTFMALKSLSFELARATRRNYFIPFSGKGAWNKMHAFSSSVHSSTDFGLILIYPFSVTPYKYYKHHRFVWATHLISLCGYGRFHKWSGFFGSPGILSLKGKLVLVITHLVHIHG